jgi:arabinofuranosyltransferase
LENIKQSKRAGEAFLKSLLAVAPLLLISFFAYKARNYQLDDALIYLRYVRNLWDGNGLVYNTGERFNGLTSATFTYTSIVFTSFIPNPILATNIASAIALFGAAMIGPRLFCVTSAAQLLTAVSIASFSFTYSTFGMETTTFLFLLSLALLLYKQDSDWFVVALGAAMATRSEAIFLALPMGLDYLYVKRRLPAFQALAIGTAIYLAPLLFNFAYYGSPIPATANAKFGQGRSGLWGDGWIFLDMSYLLQSAFAKSKFAAWVFGIMAIAGITLKRKSHLTWIVVVFLVGLFSFYTLANVPNYHWYYMPFFYFMIIFACMGVDELLHLCLTHDLIQWNVIKDYRLDIRVVGLAVLAGFYFAASPKMISFSELGRNENYAQIGNWLKANTPQNAKVAAVEIGTVGWYSDRYIIDILGLVSPYNADFIGNRQFNKWVEIYQPDYILRHEPLWIHERSTDMLETFGAYRPRQGFNFPGYVLLERAAKPDVIRALGAIESSDSAVLAEMEKSPDAAPPRVAFDGTELFAHAPSTVIYKLKAPGQRLAVTYGLRGPAGRHHGVCFEIDRLSDGVPLMHDCIEPSATESEMRRHQVVTVAAPAGETLVFKTGCETASCDFAWSYWRDVLLTRP